MVGAGRCHSVVVIGRLLVVGTARPGDRSGRINQLNLANMEPTEGPLLLFVRALIAAGKHPGAALFCRWQSTDLASTLPGGCR